MENTTRHPVEVLTIVLTASIFGRKTYLDFADFAEVREELLLGVLTLEDGNLSHDTFSRTFRLLELIHRKRKRSGWSEDLARPVFG